MQNSLIPQDLLRSSKKILIVAHLALGDFTYLQNCFYALAKAYPDLRIDLWIDEVRRTGDASQWPHLAKYSLYDWVEACPVISKIYRQTYSPALLKKSLLEAQAEAYPVVVSLAVLRRHWYAGLARRISPHGFVVGMKKRVRFFDIRKHLIYRKLNAVVPPYQATSVPQAHISDIYASWFAALFGIESTSAERFPFVQIPAQWSKWAEEQIAAWGWKQNDNVVFLNAFSKSPERSWPLERIIELATAMRAMPAWKNAAFIVNVVPEKMAQAKALFATCALSDIQLFSAEENFFQLPAILAQCKLIVSVETAVMHLANAVHVPVIALMRQTSPEWTPIDAANSKVITVASRKGWVTEISVKQVIEAMQSHEENTSR
ncbi:glycosyltransferase family 9 protein [Herbaspirillum sp. RTI4]|uniref:glycosyltransferase family 9 protein n=1 Tax=Herbaspirillum sp. RTI4 TaxID=3048640 RepID=UPI002AB393D6|nr:glycosyltransferase family 9 protein [Herbaspirillum sp. RTI4]MDY7580015.1 glycosyltransferase family 9 protein [Herbaspirillum sp. RTI4]MEA9982829.1 glycosyltransferase family 9 protein [Herbaspirillum sp. RTI4]